MSPPPQPEEPETCNVCKLPHDDCNCVFCADCGETNMSEIDPSVCELCADVCSNCACTECKQEQV